MGAYGNMDPALAGLQHGLDPDIETGIAQEEIAYGEAVFGHQGTEEKVYAAHIDRATLTLDADLVTGNTITTTINGIVVATVFATSHAATMTAHIAAINAKAELIALGISAEAGSTNRIIVLKGKGLDLAAASVVTGGASQAGSTTAYDTWATFLGIALFHQCGGEDYGAGNGAYQQDQEINILRSGTAWAVVAAAVLDKEAAYVILATGATQGQFTNVAGTNNYLCGGYFRSNRLNGLAIFEARGLK
jgi:hypothetical protein